MIDKDACILIADPQHPLCNGYERVQHKAKISKEHHACYAVVGSVSTAGMLAERLPEPIFLNVLGARESIPRNRFRQPM